MRRLTTRICSFRICSFITEITICIIFTRIAAAIGWLLKVKLTSTEGLEPATFAFNLMSLTLTSQTHCEVNKLK